MVGREQGINESQPGAAGLSGLGQIAVTALDIGRSIRFYRDVLGLEFLFQAGNLAFFDLDGVRLMLAEPESGEDVGSASVLYFNAPDLEAKVEGLRSRGVVFVDAPHVVHRTAENVLWMAFFRDPDGHLLALMDDKPSDS
jgi:catechol 2,3-dioxygenase-like lactoylglutathione lyase family enzyme